MSTIILDMSSGNTCQNNIAIVKQMIDAIKAIDTGKHEIMLKWQLSLPDGINIPLDHDVFDFAYQYGNEQGYKVTSSVADLESLKFLLQYDIPFVKLPNCRELDWLIGEIPRKVPVYVSSDSANIVPYEETGDEYTAKVVYMACVSKYPASIEDYEATNWNLRGVKAISDHTTNFDLWHKYQPAIFEKHFKLPDSTGLDAEEFAIVPDELKKIL